MKILRPITIEGDIAYVPLTRGYVAIIDVEDVPLVEGYNWQSFVVENTVYAKRSNYGSTTYTVFMHREISEPEEGQHVDHKDRNGLNNRRHNLRNCSNAENQWNGAKRSDNSSGYKGVHFHKRSGKWVARIRINGKRINLGTHSTPEDAHQAYCEASNEHHQAFGHTG